LAKSYFNGSGMTTNQFFQTILDQYPVRKVMCGAVTMEAMPERFCHGLTSEGDEVKLTSERIEIIGHLRGKPPSTD